MTDRQIIELLQKRDQSGIEEAERQYGQRLTRVAERLLLKEDAEECVNDVFLALWNHVPKAESTVLIRYLLAILKNLVRNRWKAGKTRKQQMETVPLSDEVIAEYADPGSDTEGEAILSAADVVNRFLTGQDPEKRTMFVLRYWYDFSIREIADRYGCSYAKAAKTLNRMKDELKKEIRKDS